MADERAFWMQSKFHTEFKLLRHRLVRTRLNYIQTWLKCIVILIFCLFCLSSSSSSLFICFECTKLCNKLIFQVQTCLWLNWAINDESYRCWLLWNKFVLPKNYDFLTFLLIFSIHFITSIYFDRSFLVLIWSICFRSTSSILKKSSFYQIFNFIFLHRHFLALTSIENGIFFVFFVFRSTKPRAPPRYKDMYLGLTQ